MNLVVVVHAWVRKSISRHEAELEQNKVIRVEMLLEQLASSRRVERFCRLAANFYSLKTEKFPQESWL